MLLYTFVECYSCMLQRIPFELELEVQLHVEDSLGQLPVGENFRTLSDIAGGCDILKMRD